MESFHRSSITDVQINLPSFQEVLEVLTFQAGFNTAVVVTGTTLLGIAAGLIGTFALLRNRALIGDALAHSTLPGLAAAFIIASMLGIEARNLSVLLLGATVSGILGIFSVQLIVRFSRLQHDTAIGIVLSCFFGVGIVLMSVIQNLGTGEEGGLHHFIFGQTAAMNQSDSYLILAIALFALLVCVALLKEFRLLCFDDQFAQSDGWPVHSLDIAIMSLIVLVTVVGLQAVGLLLIIALLIIPPAAARFWTERLSVMTIVSGVIGGASGYFGASASALLPRLPAGAVIVLTSGVIFFMSFLFAPKRGVIASLIASALLRLRIAKEHLLRETFELKEIRGENPLETSSPISLADLPVTQSWSLIFRSTLLLLLQAQGILRKTSAGIQLTQHGIELSAKKARNHRLWEEYLVSHSELSPSQVDYSADFVEHFISPEIIHELEQSLIAQGLLSSSTAVPASVHTLEDIRNVGEE